VVKAHRNLFQILDAAADDGAVRRDLLPKRLDKVNLPPMSQRDINPMELSELFTLADVIDPRYRIAVLLGGLAGLRIGEVAGFQRQHFTRRDTGPWLHVEHQLDRDGSFVDCKTDSSARFIDLEPMLESELTRHMKLYPAADKPWETLVTSPQSGPLHYNNFLSRVWNPAQERMADVIPGWERRTPHDLRHTHAALLIQAGVHLKVIASRLGHQSTRTTEDVYGHLLRSSETQASAALSKIVTEASDAAKLTQQADNFSAGILMASGVHSDGRIDHIEGLHPDWSPDVDKRTA
jgi:integrase